MPEAKKLNLKKHFLVLLITISIFFSGFFLSNSLTKKKIEQISDVQQDLRIDILSLETQFSILNQSPCDNLDETTLTKELYNISKKLASIENSLGRNNPAFLRLKKFYSILEVKHWLFLRKAIKDCDLNLASILYLYSDKKTCPKCHDQGYILSYFRQKYPFLRVYSFDYDLDLSIIETLKSVYRLKKETPIIIINDNVYYGFKNKEELKNILGKYVELKEETETTTEPIK